MERNRQLEQAAALCEGKRHAEAIQSLRSILADDPHDLEALALLGDAQLADHDSDAALITATTAIELDPERDLPHRQASIASSRRGLHRQAIAHAEQAIHLAPTEAAAFVVLARAVLRAKTDLPRARRAAIQAIVLAPDHAESYLVFGMVSAVEREDAAAEAALHRALTLDPGNATARNQLDRLTLRRAAAARPAPSVRPATGSAAAAGPDTATDVSRGHLDSIARALRFVISRRRATAQSTAS
jgi:tetratricopeptide (TPR) repeat protein